MLVVDDHESIRAVLAETLAEEGHEVAQAADGADALALLATWAEGQAMTPEQAIAYALEDTPDATEQTATPA